MLTTLKSVSLMLERNWCCDRGSVKRKLLQWLNLAHYWNILSVEKTTDNLPGQAGHWDLHLPDWVSYLPRAVLIVIPCYIRTVLRPSPSHWCSHRSIGSAAVGSCPVTLSRKCSNGVLPNCTPYLGSAAMRFCPVTLPSIRSSAAMGGGGGGGYPV